MNRKSRPRNANIIAKFLYKTSLKILIVAISTSALLGIFALLRRDLDDWSAKSVFSTLLISGSSILIIGNSIKNGQRTNTYFFIPLVGIISSALALSLCLYLIWYSSDSPEIWKTFGSLVIISLACTHSSLLSLMPLPQRYRFLQVVATLFAITLSTSIIWSIWYGSWLLNWRVAGITGVCLASITILIPVISRLVTLQSSPNQIVKYCPGCGGNATYNGRQTRCRKCKNIFLVRTTKKQ